MGLHLFRIDQVGSSIEASGIVVVGRTDLERWLSGSIGIMEKKMETTVIGLGLGFRVKGWV